ncbi:MAG: MerR family transcriptional regulator [Eubacteriales bacterium]|nr:MerR family transcriptional regulator [Eubacteriales bacterium]
MEKEKYLIGDVANLMGLSRDTLRYYEKRGILSSEKGDNGYRYYNERDISKLIGILYQRKMDIGLDDMEELWSEDGTLDKLTRITRLRLEEEKKAIRKHEQTVARLRITQNDCENINHHLNQVTMQNFPSAYVIIPHTTIKESVELWFQYARDYSGLDMMYAFDEYTWKPEGSSISTEYKNTQLILHRDLQQIVDYDVNEQSTPVTNPALCVSSFCISEDRTPAPSAILPMIEWARKQGLMISHQLYSTFAFQGLHRGRNIYYLQIYIPVF